MNVPQSRSRSPRVGNTNLSVRQAGTHASRRRTSAYHRIDFSALKLHVALAIQLHIDNAFDLTTTDTVTTHI